MLSTIWCISVLTYTHRVVECKYASSTHAVVMRASVIHTHGPVFIVCIFMLFKHQCKSNSNCATPLLFALQLWCGRRQRCRWWRAMPPVETTLSKLVMEYLVAEYRGSGDLEVFDALDFCDFSRRNTQRQTTDTISRRASSSFGSLCNAQRQGGTPPATSLTWLPLMPPPIRGSC